MTTPVALVYRRSPAPGHSTGQSPAGFGYRVITQTDPPSLVTQAAGAKPFLIVMDLAGRTEITDVIRDLKSNPDTAHIPILAFAKDGQETRRNSAHQAGATLVAGDTAVLAHLPNLLQQVLELET